MFGAKKKPQGQPLETATAERIASARYLADMAAQCARLARSNGLDGLGYLFDMAHLEARNAAGDRGRPETTS